MKKVFAILMVVLVMLTPTWSTGCGAGSSGPELPGVYGNRTLKGIRFKYPVEWRDVTSYYQSDMTENMESLVMVDSSDSVSFSVMGIKHEAGITDEDAEYFTDAMETSLLKDVEIISSEDTIVDGQSGREKEFRGTVGPLNGNGKGYILTFYRGNERFMVIWASKPGCYEKMLPVYDKVKDSITFADSSSDDEGDESVEPAIDKAPINLATPRDVGEIEYETYSLEGVRFNYPSGWKWSKNELVAGSGAMWEDPTYSAILIGVVTVWPSPVQPEEMEETAIAFSDEMINLFMDKYDTAVNNRETEVAGQWAMEMEIDGRISGRKYVGYILNTYHQATQFSIVFFVDEKDWDDLGGIYYDIKDSIEFSGGWTRRFGGKYKDSGSKALQTTDGYIIVGTTESSGAGKSDVWLVKTNPRGYMEWDKTYGGTEREVGNSIVKTSDGGYVIIGYTESYGEGGKDLWLIKTSSKGNKLWDKTLGGSAQDLGVSVVETNDGDYVAVGSTYSFGTGTKDAWLVKFNSTGEVLWEKTFGLDGSDEARSIFQTQDGGYIITGQTSSVEEGIGEIWLIKTDSQGNAQWQKTLGTGYGNAAIQLDDGGYFIAGSSLIRTDSEGNSIWETRVGSSMDEGTSALQTSEGNFIVTGHLRKYSGNTLVSSVWLTELDDAGKTVFTTAFGGTKRDQAYSVQQTNDGGYVISGYTETYGVSGSGDVWLIKTDPQGNVE